MIFGVSLILSNLTHAIYIRPVALKLKNYKGFLRYILIFSGEDLSDYWDVEKFANDTKDISLIKKVKFMKYYMYSMVTSLVLILVFGFVYFIINIFFVNTAL